MNSVSAFYQHRTDGTELVNHEKTISSPAELADLFDNYPWESELALSEEQGEGGGFYFVLDGEKGQFASYQFVPMELGQGLLDLEIVLEPGFLWLFGRKSVSKSFDVVSTVEAKSKIQELLQYSLESLYQKYRK